MSTPASASNRATRARPPVRSICGRSCKMALGPITPSVCTPSDIFHLLRSATAGLYLGPVWHLEALCPIGRPLFHLRLHRFAPFGRLAGLVSAGLPILHLRLGDGPGLVEVEIEVVLRLRPGIADLAQIIEGARKARFQEGLETAQQVAPPEPGAARSEE